MYSACLFVVNISLFHVLILVSPIFAVNLDTMDQCLKFELMETNYPPRILRCIFFHAVLFGYIHQVIPSVSIALIVPYFNDDGS